MLFQSWHERLTICGTGELLMRQTRCDRTIQKKDRKKKFTLWLSTCALAGSFKITIKIKSSQMPNQQQPKETLTAQIWSFVTLVIRHLSLSVWLFYTTHSSFHAQSRSKWGAAAWHLASNTPAMKIAIHQASTDTSLHILFFTFCISFYLLLPRLDTSAS